MAKMIGRSNRKKWCFESSFLWSVGSFVFERTFLLNLESDKKEDVPLKLDSRGVFFGEPNYEPAGYTEQRKVALGCGGLTGTPTFERRHIQMRNGSTRDRSVHPA